MLARIPLLFAGPASGGDGESASGASVADAREALACGRDRLSSLPWHRRAAHREARTMVSRSRARLVRAQLEDRRLGSLAFALEPLIAALGQSRRDHARWLWRVLPRRARWWLLAPAIVAIGSLAALALLAVVAGHLLGV